MDKLPIIFASGNNFSSLLIRAFTLSKWSHVGIIDGDYVIDTQLLTGCIKTPIEEWKRKYLVWEEASIACPRGLEKALAFTNEQIGTKYDWRGIIGFVVRMDEFERKDRYFCNELILHASGILTGDIYLTSPQTVYFFAKNLNLGE